MNRRHLATTLALFIPLCSAWAGTYTGHFSVRAIDAETRDPFPNASGQIFVTAEGITWELDYQTDELGLARVPYVLDDPSLDPDREWVNFYFDGLGYSPDGVLCTGNYDAATYFHSGYDEQINLIIGLYCKD